MSKERTVTLKVRASLVERLERVAEASARTLEAEVELVLDQHAADWEDRTRHARGTTEIATYHNQTREARRLQAEAAREAAAEFLRLRRIENVRRLQNWVEIDEPEERRGGHIYDPATGETWRPYRGVLFNRDQADPCPHDPVGPRAFYIQDGEVVAFEPVGVRPVPVVTP